MDKFEKEIRDLREANYNDLYIIAAIVLNG